MRRVAILLRGGVSRTDGKIRYNNNSTNHNYTNITCVSNSIKKHILEVNNNYIFDFYIHSWELNLKSEFDRLYKPVFSMYEENSNYTNLIFDKLKLCGLNESYYNQVSQSISISNSCKMFKTHVNKQRIDYDIVILYRPDVLLWKDMILDTYSKDVVYSNSYKDCEGDFHFVFNPNKIDGFINLFQHISIDNPPIPHLHIKKHLRDNCNFILSNDDIIAGQDQEVVRKLNYLDNKTIFLNYGISLEEITSYSN